MRASLALLAVIVFSTSSPAQQIGSAFGYSAENPGISAVGEILARYEAGEWGGGLGNAELGFQAPIDPFGRADILLHYASGVLHAHHEHEDEEEEAHEHGTGFAVEEALITLTSLPGKTQLSAGRMRSRIGLLNVVHLHDFSFIEYPRIITDYWGEEGLSVDGLRLSWLAPLPFWTEVVAEGQRTGVEDATSFGTGGLHLFFPMGESVGLGLTGFGYMDKPAHEETENNEPQDWGLNGWGTGFRLKWVPPERALYTHVLLQAELMSRAVHEDDLFGFYAMTEYKFTRRWAAGAMFEHNEHLHQHGEETETEEQSWGSLAVSYQPSEFQRMRAQFDLPVDVEEADSRVTLQWTFLIGPHKPHSY
ncbi:MAG: hypothetical protein MUE60_03105 [Candidatus Eisenbacteria bacterium]|jgi:hypothetical protein|nr:hypothetical protein [Candidatus Eisenbacteria bacterium]